jgi:hypothetical protein
MILKNINFYSKHSRLWPSAVVQSGQNKTVHEFPRLAYKQTLCVSYISMPTTSNMVLNCPQISKKAQGI